MEPTTDTQTQQKIHDLAMLYLKSRYDLKEMPLRMMLEEYNKTYEALVNLHNN